MPWIYVMEDLNGEENVGSLVFRVGKVIKRKGDKLYVKWKGYHNFFNSWIDKKDILI